MFKLENEAVTHYVYMVTFKRLSARVNKLPVKETSDVLYTETNCHTS